ncbi:MerR family transcriptional regulator, light-induced transcriptional regulator [Gammaproteobacteria bacterium]
MITTVDAEESYTRYLKALLAGDRQQCRILFETWLAADTDLRVMYQNLIQRSLYDVGSLWEQGRISVATEHLATAITESLLNLVYPRLFSQPRLGKSVVVTCATNEHHQIGGKMVADIMEMNGWRSYFLGANTPTSDLLALIREKNPDAVALSLAVHFNLESLLQTTARVRTEFPEVPILVGGQAFRWGGWEQVEQIADVRYLGSLDALTSWMTSQTATDD